MTTATNDLTKAAHLCGALSSTLLPHITKPKDLDSPTITMISRTTKALPEGDFEPLPHIMHTQPHPSSISLPTNPSDPIHQHPPPILPTQNAIDPNIYLQPNPVLLGDSLQEDKPTNITRLYFANVNGLNLTGDGGDLTDICNQMKTIEANIIPSPMPLSAASTPVSYPSGESGWLPSSPNSTNSKSGPRM
jgi:hypothetical protein